MATNALIWERIVGHRVRLPCGRDEPRDELARSPQLGQDPLDVVRTHFVDAVRQTLLGLPQVLHQADTRWSRSRATRFLTS